MSTLNQIKKHKRSYTRKKSRTTFLGKNPHKIGICTRVYTTKPKKPHSAQRKIAKVYLRSRKRYVLANIPGQGHNPSNYSQVFLRGGRVRDIPGVHARILRNKLDLTFPEKWIRTRRRSKYGITRKQLEEKLGIIRD